MRAAFTPHFKRSYKNLPQEVRQAFDKQLGYLLKNFRHPSLRAKKYDERRNLWQARVTGHYRFYFEVKGETYLLHEIKVHED